MTDFIPAFLLTCYLGTTPTANLYFADMNECKYYMHGLSGQTIKKAERTDSYNCSCKLIPKVNPKTTKIY